MDGCKRLKSIEYGEWPLENRTDKKQLNKDIKKSVRGKKMIQTIKMINTFLSNIKNNSSNRWNKKTEVIATMELVYKLNSASGIEKDRTEDVRAELSRKQKYAWGWAKNDNLREVGPNRYSWQMFLFSLSLTVDKPRHRTRDRKQVHQRPICHQRRNYLASLGYKGVTWSFQIALSITTV